jgi:AbrB family looped-hinge helix DNA binding protein
MKTRTLSSKGQIIIPKALRDSHHWQAGTKFVIEETAMGLLLKPASCFPSSMARDGLGCAWYTGPFKSDEEMKEGVDEALRKQWQKIPSR